MHNFLLPVYPLSHWHHLLKEFSASPMELFEEVEVRLRLQQIPDVKITRVEWREKGLFSAQREYLRAGRGQYVFDLCAAPFGSNFFVSWWFGEQRPSPIIPAIVAVVAVIFVMYLLGFWGGLLMLPLLFVAVGGFLGYAEREVNVWFFVTPLLGPLWQRFFAPKTYYATDTWLMYQETIHRTVLEVVDMMAEQRGVKPPDALHREPVMLEFFGKK